MLSNVGGEVTGGNKKKRKQRNSKAFKVAKNIRNNILSQKSDEAFEMDFNFTQQQIIIDLIRKEMRNIINHHLNLLPFG